MDFCEKRGDHRFARLRVLMLRDLGDCKFSFFWSLFLSFSGVALKLGGALFCSEFVFGSPFLAPIFGSLGDCTFFVFAYYTPCVWVVLYHPLAFRLAIVSASFLFRTRTKVGGLFCSESLLIPATNVSFLFSHVIYHERELYCITPQLLVWRFLFCFTQSFEIQANV